jgi:hypothetical protein
MGYRADRVAFLVRPELAASALAFAEGGGWAADAGARVEDVGVCRLQMPTISKFFPVARSGSQ